MGKINRPLVKMSYSNNENDLLWYSTMMGRQSQIITLLEKQLELKESTNKILRETVVTVKTHRDLLQKEIDKDVDKVFTFRLWNLFIKKLIRWTGRRP